VASARTVARYFFRLAEAEPVPEYLTHHRLQNLLYYAQGWHLARQGLPLFPERIYAWAQGPVVRALFPKFDYYGFAPIPFAHVLPSKRLTQEEQLHIRAVWEVYKQFSGTKLREMTLAEKPWVNARKGYGPEDKCNAEITKEALQTFFTALQGQEG
jgi:uncharacterized phage-associated protein